VIGFAAIAGIQQLGNIGMSNRKQYERDCRKLGELQLNVDGTTQTFCSPIMTPPPSEEIDAFMQYFDTADETGEPRYRIYFGITEI
jgi:hypothetical protein